MGNKKSIYGDPDTGNGSDSGTQGGTGNSSGSGSGSGSGAGAGAGGGGVSRDPSAGEVARRTKAKKKGKQKRPASDPINPPGAFDHPNFSLYMKAADDVISGRQHGPKEQFTATNPLGPDGADVPKDYYDSPYDLAHAMPGQPSQGSPQDGATYINTLDAVLRTWPEFRALKEINVSDLHPDTVTVIHQVLRKLSDQHSNISRLTQEVKDKREALEEIREERDAHAQTLRKRHLEVTGLRDDVASLRKELQKYGREWTGSSDAPPRTPEPHDYYEFSPRENEADLGETDEQKFRRRQKGGIFQATPLVLAEGHDNWRVAVVQRTQSLRPVDRSNLSDSGSDRAPTPTRTPTPTPTSPPAAADTRLTDASADTQVQVKLLQAALDRERRQNETRKQRLEVMEQTMTPQLLQKVNVVPVEYVAESFQNLEHVAMGKIGQSMTHFLGHVPARRQQQFLCAVVQTSYDISLLTVRKFKEIIQSLLLNPTKSDVSTASMNGDTPPRHAVSGQVQKFEFMQPLEGHGSKLAKRTHMLGEVPDVLIRQISNFLENMADVTNIASLIENVVDELSHGYRDCTTPALLNQASFSQFVHDCCRLAWKMCVRNPPMVIVSNDRWRFDERYHVAHLQDNVVNAQVDYYGWPILLTRANGEVMCRGRVLLK